MKKITQSIFLFLLLLNLTSCLSSKTINADPIQMRKFKTMSNKEKFKNLFSGKFIAPSRKPDKVIKVKTYGFFQNLKEDSIFAKDIERSFEICGSRNPEFVTIKRTAIDEYISSFLFGYIYGREIKVWCK